MNDITFYTRVVIAYLLARTAIIRPILFLQFKVNDEQNMCCANRTAAFFRNLSAPRRIITVI